MRAKITPTQLNRFCQDIQDAEGKHGQIFMTLIGVACEFSQSNQLNHLVALNDLDVGILATMYCYTNFLNQPAAPATFFTQMMNNQEDINSFYSRANYLQQLGILKSNQGNISFNAISMDVRPPQNSMNPNSVETDSRKRRASALDDVRVQFSGENENVVVATIVPNPNLTQQRPVCSHELIAKSLNLVLNDKDHQLEKKENEIESLKESNRRLNEEVKKLKLDNIFLIEHYTLLATKLKSQEAKNHSTSSSSASVLPPLARPTPLRQMGIYPSAFQKPQEPQPQSSSPGVIKPFEFAVPASRKRPE